MQRSKNVWPAATQFLILVSFTFLIGCGGSSDKGRGIPVSGTITLAGVPVEGVNVTFLNDTFAGYARTDAGGNYRLVQGALPGTNRIVISKIEGGVDPNFYDPESGMDAGQIDAAAMGSGIQMELPKNLVPDEYGDPLRTRLTFEVPSDGATGVNFNI